MLSASAKTHEFIHGNHKMQDDDFVNDTEFHAENLAEEIFAP